MSDRDKILRGVWDALTLFPLSFAVGACSGFGVGGGIVTALACSLFGLVFARAYVPGWQTLLPVFFVTFHYGAPAGGAAVVLAGVFVFLLSLLPQNRLDRLRDASIRAGLLVSMAFLTTALQTNAYFGIGALGGDLREILADYVSRGFHPNWRGILYGTIALVILITYPRKFKRFSRKIGAPFAAVLVTFALHLALVPDALHSPVNETGTFALRADIAAASPLGGIAGGAGQILLAALALALLLTATADAAENRRLSAALLCCGAAGGAPFTTDGKRRARLSALVSALVCAVLYLCPALGRMPVHTLGVVLIVTAWQSVDWHAVKTACTGGVRSVLLFVLALALPLALGIQWALPLLAAAAFCLPRRERQGA